MDVLSEVCKSNQVSEQVTSELLSEIHNNFIDEKTEECPTDEFIDTLCPIVRTINIKDIYENGKFALIVSPVQSGKTNAIIDLALYIRSIDTDSVIIFVTQNYISHKEQFKARYDCIREKIYKYNEDLKEYQDPVIELDDIFDASSLKPTNRYKTIISLSNANQIDKLVENLNKRRKKNIYLFIDEVDITYKNDDTKFSENFPKLREFSHCIFGITATPMDSIFEEKELKTKFVYTIPISECYKGIEHLKTILVETELPKRGKNVLETDTAFINTMLSISNLDYRSLYTHPVHILIKTSFEKTHHIQYLNSIRDTEGLEKWTVIIFNGNGILVYSPILYSKITIKGKKKIRGADECFTFSNSELTYPELISFLCKNSKCGYICTISGKYAERGFSFVGENYEVHLTHEYYISSKTTTGTSLMQSMRLLGIYNDDIPLTLITTKDTLDDLKKTHSVQKKIIDTSKERAQNECIMEITEMIKNMKLTNKDFPKRKISKLSRKLEELMIWKNEWSIKKCIQTWYNKPTLSGKILGFLYKNEKGVTRPVLEAFLLQNGSSNASSFVSELLNKSQEHHYFLLYERKGDLYMLKNEARNYMDKHLDK